MYIPRKSIGALLMSVVEKSDHDAYRHGAGRRTPCEPKTTPVAAKLCTPRAARRSDDVIRQNY
jgi:hypothetical protein